MRSRILTLLAIAVLAFNSAAFAFTNAPAQTTNEAELLKLLPASDAVFAINVKRVLNDALPTLFAAKPEWVAKVKTGLNDFQAKTGFDARSVDTAVVGLNIKPTEGGKYSVEPVVIAKGSFSGASLIALLRAGADEDVRVEKVGTKTMILIDVKDEAKKAGDAAVNANDTAKDVVEKMDSSFSDEMAVAAMPNGALAFGTVARVRQTLVGDTKLDPALSPILAKYPGAVAKFGSITPAGMSEYIPIDNDFLGNTLNGIRTLGGAMNVTPATSTFMLSASTGLPEQAKGIYDMLDGLMMIGKNIFGASSRDDQKTYLRLIEAAKLTLTENTVELTLPVAQSDIDSLVRSIKEKKADEADTETSADAAEPATPADDEN